MPVWTTNKTVLINGVVIQSTVFEIAILNLARTYRKGVEGQFCPIVYMFMCLRKCSNHVV